MKSPKAILTLLATLLLASSAPALAQGPEPERPNRERELRWRDMAGPRRHDMRQRFDRLHRMEAEKRREILNRAQLLREIMVDVYRNMDAAARARIDALDPAERASLLGQLALEEARSRSREARLILGSADATPAEGQSQRTAREDRRALHEAFLVHARQRLGEYVAKNGLPKGITQAQWDEFTAMQGRQFGHRLHQFADQYPDLVKVIGPPPGPPQMDRERWELNEAMRLPPREHMNLVDPEGKTSPSKEMKIRRKRVMAVLKSQKGMSEQRLQEVRDFTDEEFMRWMHRRLRPGMGPEGEPGPGGRPRMGPPPEEGPGMGPPGEGPPPWDRMNRPPREGRRPEGPRGPRVSPRPPRNHPPKPQPD